jgi:signal transduction histidine kinase/CheY-like chemotaxis protein
MPKAPTSVSPETTTQARRGVDGPARLIVLTGKQIRTRYTVEDRATIGRGSEANIVLDDPEVSRRHAHIHRSPIGFLLEDLSSHNGTMLNGVPIEHACLLNFGDKIELGSQVLLFTHYDRVEQQMLERQRLETLGRLGAGIAHDFNNLLAVVISNLDYIGSLPAGQRLDDEEVTAALSDIRMAGEQAAELTPRLIAIARREEYAQEHIDLSQLCLDILQLVRRTFDRRIVIKHQIDPKLFVRGDSVELNQVLMNLCLNARDAMSDGGVLNITAQLLSANKSANLSLPTPGQHVAVMVSDTGEGMDEETCSRIFEPFFSTKQTGAGYGLGLAVVQEIATVHGGRVGVKSSPGRGSRFAVYLPAVAEPEPRKKQSMHPKPFAPEPKDGAAQPVIMLIDDEHAVRRSLRRVLSRAGYRIAEAADGSEALALYPLHEPTPDLVIVDLDMPNMSGEETQRLLRELNPNVRVLVLSGHQDAEREANMREGGALGFIEKPCHANTLIEAVEHALTTPFPVDPPTTENGRRTAATSSPNQLEGVKPPQP